MRWKITIEGLDEFSGHDSAEMVIEKPFSRLSEGEIGLSISDGKSIMALWGHRRIFPKSYAKGGWGADQSYFVGLDGALLAPKC